MGNADATATLRINTIMDTGDAISNINSIQKALKQLKMPKNMTKDTEAQLEEIVSLTKQYNNLLDKPNKSNADLRQLDQLERQLDNAYSKASKFMKEMDFGKINTNEIHTEGIDELITKLEKAQQELRKIEKAKMNPKGAKEDLDILKDTLGKQAGPKSQSRRRYNDLMGAIDNGDLKETLRLLEEIQKKNNSLAGRKENPITWADKAQDSIKNLIDYFTKIEQSESGVDSKSEKLRSTISTLNSEIQQMRADEIAKMEGEVGELANGLSRAADEANAFNSAMSAAAHSQTEMQQQVSNLQQQVKNYFGLDEIFRKIGQLGREALDTVKELDAAMTETAVVTNFDVSDMWGMLPEYTQNANELGSTIADVYNAATLYYQQGLDTAQSMGLANETLKMARIGGIEAAEATDMMTAALRGFNMEINETSAQRINDVYSKLAAITAADTKEIGTAMERTASIANSAGMDFETTSAFLAQMIETTREAPENLGTAMKTIVARFQEMKVDPNSLIDSEGERLDYNRVDKALKSVGISLVDQNNQFRDADDVFLEIASRWDGMSQAQQRYIATIAAGSRQQSRFIAMMQDYDRTIELVDAAYTSAGAGQAQFEKTLESMDSKLNRLKNAWDQFAMGFMNADFLKVGVDLGTKFLDIFEKIITAISQVGVIDPFKSIIKSALTVTAIFGGMLGATKLLMGGIGKFAGIAMGEDRAQKMSGFVGAMNTPTEKQRRKQAIREQFIEETKERRKLEKQIAHAGGYYTKDNKKSGFSLKQGQVAKKEIADFSKQISQQISENGSIDLRNLVKKGRQLNNSKALDPIFQRASESLSGKLTSDGKELSTAGQAAAKQYVQGMLSGLHSSEVEVRNKAQKMLFDLNDGNALIKDGEKDVKIDKVSFKDIANEVSGELKATNDTLNTGSKGLETFGGKAIGAGNALQQFGANLMGTPLQPFGSALMLAGQGLENLGMLFSSGITKVKEFAMSMHLAGAGITGMTAAEAIAEGETMKLSAVMKGLGYSIKEAMAPLLPFIAAAAALGIAFYSVYRAATQEQRAMKTQNDVVAQAGQDLDTSRQVLEAITNDLAELADNDTALDGLIEGTAEWNSKLAEANGHIIEMMGNYKTLSTMEGDQFKYVKTDDNGRMSITKEGQELIKAEQEKVVNLANANNVIQTAYKNNLTDLYSKEYKRAKAMVTSDPGQDAGSTRGVAKGMLRGQTYVGLGNKTGEDAAQAIAEAKALVQQIESQNKAREELAWETGIHAALGEAQYGSPKAVEKILSKTIDVAVEDATKDFGNFSRKENEEMYAELMNYQRVGKGKFQDQNGNDIERDYGTIKEQLPELQALNKAQEEAKTVQKGVNTLQKDFSDIISKAADGTEEYSESQDELISNVLGMDLETNLDDLSKFLETGGGLEQLMTEVSKHSGDENYQKMLTSMTQIDASNEEGYKKASEKLRDIAAENGEKLQTQIYDDIGKVAQILTTEAGMGNKDNVKNIVESMTASQRSAFAETTEDLADNVGRDTAKSYANFVEEQFKGNKGGNVDALNEIISGIDFSSPLNAIEGIKKAMASSNSEVKDWAEDWQEGADSARTTAKAFQDTFGAQDVTDELGKNLDKYINESGEFTAKTIEDLAKNAPTLQRYLDATGASASGVAKAFTALQKGDIDFSELTPGLVAVIDQMDQLANNAERADRAMENISSDNDTGRYKDFLDQSKETLQEYVDNKEYGNEALEETLSAAMGSDRWAKAYSEGPTGIKKLFELYKSATEATAKEISGLYKDGMGIDEMLLAIQEKYKVTADTASIMLQRATNTNLDLKKKLEQGNVKEAISASIKASGIDPNKGGKGYVSTGDLKNQALMAGATDAEQVEYVKQYAEQLNIGGEKIKEIASAKDVDKAVEVLAKISSSVSDFTYETSGADVNKSLQEDYQGTKAYSKYEEQVKKANESGGPDVPKGKQFWWSTGTGVKQDASGNKLVDTYDLDKIYERAFQYTGNETQAQETTFEAMKQGIAEGIKFYSGGKLIEPEDAEEITDVQSLIDYRKESQESEQYSLMGEAMANPIATAVYQAVLEGFSNQPNTDAREQNAEDIIKNLEGREEKVRKTKEENDLFADKEKRQAYTDLLSAGVMGPNGSAQQATSLIDNLNALISQMQSDKLSQDTQLQMVSGYLQQMAPVFADLSSQDQASVLSELSSKLEGFNAVEFANIINQALGTSFEGKDFGGDHKFGSDTDNTKLGNVELNQENLAKQLEEMDLHANIEGDLQINGINGGKGKTAKGKATGQNNPNSAFRRTGTMARGSGGGYTIPGRPTLMGEEGEEVVWEPKRNEAYIVGSNGPQFGNISKDAVVWNAKQTKKIKKNSGSVGSLGTGARGINRVGTMSEGASGDIGTLTATIDATANIKDIDTPEEPFKIPVIADIKVEGEKEGGIKAALNKIFGGGGKKENAHTIPVNAEVTKTSISDDAKTVKVTGQITKIDNKKKLKGVEATAKVTKVTKSGKVEGEPVKVDAKANVVSTGSVSGLESTSVTATAEVSGTEDVTTLGSRINALNSKSVNVVARVSGSQNVANLSYLLRSMPNSKDIRVTVHKKTESDSGSRGLGKYAPRGWNSLATGTKKPDPRFKGGPTLTGEEGYEVAWLPKEGKSMVLGVGGPEFVDLPKDAVVWTHQESKKILKKRQKTTMPSMGSGSDKKTITQVKKKSPSLLYGVTKTKKAEAGFFKLVLALTQSQNKMEQFSTAIDRAKDEMDKLAKSVSGSADKIRTQINEQVKNINKANKEAKLQEKKALAITKKINTSSKREKFSIAQTQHSKSKSNNFWVAEGSLVKRNKKGELVLDTKKIKKKAKEGKTAYQRNELYESLIDKGQSLIEEYNKSLKEARDKQNELDKQRDELRDTIHEIFWSWENELTKVKRLQDKISLTDSFESVISSMQSTLEAGLKAGYLNREKAEVQYQNLVRKHIQDVITKFKTQSQLSRALSNRLNEDASYTDEYAAYQKAIKETKAAKGKKNYDEKFVKEQEMKERYEAAKLGRQYYKLERDETGALVIKQLKEIGHTLTNEQYKAITDYYNQLLQDIQDLNSATSDIQSTISGLYGEITSLTSEMDSYAKTVINGMQQDEEDTIDALSDLNSSLQEAFSDLIDSVRKELDRQRKLEQNEKTEKDISNQMNRLAMLRADTSGSNATEIAQLEKEIAEATGNYEDSLEDQLLDRLQESADEAAKQRERQIEILQTQLEYTKAVGQYIAKAEILLEKLIKGNISPEDLAELKNYYFVGSSGKDGLTKWGKDLLEGEWNSALIKISNFDSNIDKLTQAIQDLTKKLIISEANEGMVENLASRIKEENNGNSEITHDQLTSLHNNNLSYQGAADLLFNLGYSKQDALKKMIKAGYTDLDYLSGVTYDGLRVLGGDLIKAGIKESEVVKYYPGNEAHATQDKATTIPSEPTKAKTSKATKTDTKKEKEASKNAGSGTVVKDIIGDPKVAYNRFLKERGSKTNSGDPNWGKIGKKGYEAQVKRGKKIGKSEYQVAKDLAGTDKLSWKQVLTAAKDAGRSGKTVKKWNPNAKSDSNFRKAFVAVYGKWAKFAQGGLASYTGPAWMDGTPSKPELVLNATDTKNFVALKDVLAEATRRGAFNHDENTNNVGDAVFDININVDKIDSDYDVDKVVKRVEKIIIDKAKHRNVTVVGRAR